MKTYFVLYLLCITCQPIQLFQLHNIPAYNGGSTVWADTICRRFGDILSGDYERRNMQIASDAGRLMAHKDYIIYTCKKESPEF